MKLKNETAVNKGPCLYCLRIKLPNAAALRQTTGLFADTSIKYGHNQDPTVLKVIKINYNEKKKQQRKKRRENWFSSKTLWQLSYAKSRWIEQMA